MQVVLCLQIRWKDYQCEWQRLEPCAPEDSNTDKASVYHLYDDIQIKTSKSSDAGIESDAGNVCRTKHVFQVKQLTSPASEYKAMRIGQDPTPSKPIIDTQRELTRKKLKRNDSILQENNTDT